MRAAVLTAVLLAVAPESERPDPSAAAGSLAVAEVLTAPAVDPNGVVFSVALRNESEQPVRVTDVVAVADEDVAVAVLGISGCRKGCAGALGWQEAAPILAGSDLHPGDVEVPPESAVADGEAEGLWVVLHVSPRDPAATAALSHRCLFVRELQVRVDDGPLHPVRNWLQDFVVALDHPDAGSPGVPRICPLL